MEKKEKTIVSRNDIIKWARSKPVFYQDLHLTSTQSLSVHFAQVSKLESVEVYLIAARKLGRDTMSAPRVRLGVMRASRAGMALVDDWTEMVVRGDEDTDASWRIKLRLACSRLGVDPDLINELGTAIRPKADAPPAQKKGET